MVLQTKINRFGLTDAEFYALKSLSTPAKIQDFLDKIPINFEEKRDTCMSPRQALKKNKAHCIEGALIAALALRIAGFSPLILDLEAHEKDFDHVVAVFKKGKYWGAISKSNHAVLRYREPVYKSIRELVLSYFHEYFINSNGQKTLRAYSDPVNLSIFDVSEWATSEKDVWFIPEYLTQIPHRKILTVKQIRNLRPADKIEIEAGKLLEYSE